MKYRLKGMFIILVFCITLATLLGTSIVSAEGGGYITEIGQIDTGGWAIDVHVDDEIVYLADLETGFRIYNVSDPSRPKQLAHMFSEGGAHQLFYDKSNDLVYLANHVRGLEIIDVSDPGNPIEIDHSYDEGGEVSEVYVVENLAYIIEHGLSVLNISNPSNPVKLGHYIGDDYMSDVKTSGEYAFLSHGEYGLDIIDISDPTNMTKVSTYVDEGMVTNAEIFGNFLFLADWNGGLKILSITDLNNPSKIGESKNATDYASDLAIAGNIAYVGGWEDGLYMYNISDPSFPTLLGNYNDGGKATGVYVQNNLVFVADTTDGLEILKVEFSLTTTTTPLEIMIPFMLSFGLLCVLKKKRKAR